ncbi:MAG: hypothetical protein J6U26_03305, partial [Lachnospiraceae bacterium]|nr:hypothetical protein [Lachnospiraceae bacterium]
MLFFNKGFFPSRVIALFLSVLLTFSGLDSCSITGGGGDAAQAVYSVTFTVYPEGTAASPRTVLVPKGSRVQRPDLETPDGYTFVTWVDASRTSVPFDFDAPVNGETALIGILIPETNTEDWDE